MSYDTKERPTQCNVLLKQVDQKKGRPTNHSEHAHKIQQITSLFVSIRTIIDTVCFIYALFIMKLLEKDLYYIYLIIYKYIYISTFCLHLQLPTNALHKTLCKFFIHLNVRVILKNNILFCKFSLLR